MMRQITREEQREARLLASWLLGYAAGGERGDAANTLYGLAIGELSAATPEDNQGLAGDGI